MLPDASLKPGDKGEIQASCWSSLMALAEVGTPIKG